jgi:Zn-finger protein
MYSHLTRCLYCYAPVTYFYVLTSMDNSVYSERFYIVASCDRCKNIPVTNHYREMSDDEVTVMKIMDL